MAEVRHFIAGTVLQDDSGSSRMEGVLVRLTARDKQRVVLLDEGLTDVQGHFRLRSQLPEGFRSHGGVRYQLEVWDAVARLPVVEGPERWSRSTVPRDFVLTVTPSAAANLLDDPEAPSLTPPSVWGVLRHSDGSPVVGATVQVRRQSLEEQETGLGPNATSDSEGVYGVNYPPQTGAVHLFVRVYADSGVTDLLATSALVLNAGEIERVDLTISDERYQAPTEYQQVNDALDSTLDGLNLNNVGLHDVLLLAATAGLSKEAVSAFVLARKLAATLTTVSEPALYAMMRAGLPAQVSRLLRREDSEWVAAMEKARANNQISQTVADTAETVKNNLRAVRKARAQDVNQDGSIAAILAAATSFNNTERETFVSAWVDHQGEEEDFWDSLSPAFTNTQIDQARKAIRIAAIVGNYLPLIQSIGDGVSAETLATWTSEDWLEHLQPEGETSLGYPGWLPEVTSEEQYAEALVRRASIAFPSSALSAGFKIDSAASDDLKDFLAEVGEFDFAAGDIDAAVDGASSPFENVAALKAELRSLKRLQRLAPGASRFVVTREMKAAGLLSAPRITRVGQERLLSQLSGVLDPESVRSVYRRAKAQTALEQVLAAATSPVSRRLSVAAIPMTEATDAEKALAAAYHGTDLCACEDCSSILGPASYFVDLLSWVSAREAFSGSGQLDQRRPDLKNLKLSCENTSTVMPYVDLALEVLEVAVAGSGNVPVETTRTSEELRAQPEKLIAVAYNNTKSVIWPFSLPFDFALEEARTYLAHLGVPREELLRVFQTPAMLVNSAIAREILGFSQADWMIVSSSVAHGNWGYTNTTVDHPDTGTADVPWNLALAYVPEFLERSGLSFEQLLDLLRTGFVNPNGNLDVVAVNTGSVCTVEDLYLGVAFPDAPSTTQPTAADFAAAPAFLRVWRALGWSMLAVDKALRSLNMTAPLAPAALESLALMKKLWAMVPKARLEVLLSWWDDLDVWEDRQSAAAPVKPLYDELFLDPTVYTDMEDNPFLLNANRTELAVADPGPAPADLMDFESELMSALTVDSADLNRAAALAEAALGTGLERRLSHLSQLHRHTSLARLAGLTVHEANSFSEMMDNSPFLGPEQAVRWWMALNEVRASGWTVAEVGWLVEHDSVAAAQFAPGEAWLRQALGPLRAGLRALDDSSEAAANDETRLREVLAQVVDPAAEAERYEALVALVLQTGTFSSQEAQEEAAALLDETLTDWVEIGTAQVKLVGNPAAGEPRQGSETDRTDRITWVVEQVGSTMLRLRREAWMVEHLGAVLGLEVSVVKALQPLALTAPNTPSFVSSYLAVEFLEETEGEDPADPWADLTPSTHAGAFQTLEVLHKIAFVLNRFKMDATGVSWWVAYGAAFWWMELGSFPLQSGVVGVNIRFAGLQRAWVSFGLEKRLQGTTPSLVALLPQPGSRAGLVGDLAARTGWTEDTLRHLLARFNLDRVRIEVVPEEFPWGEAASVTAAVAGLGVTLNGTWSNTDALLVALKAGLEGEGVTGLSLLDAGGNPTSGGGGNPALAMVAADAPLVEVQAPLLAWMDQLNADGLKQWVDALVLMARLGGSPDLVEGWLNDPSTVESGQVRLAARAQSESVKDWANVAQPLRNALRERQRRALLTWLVAHHNAPNFKNEAAVYAHYLIDPEMSPCMMTSRLKQAISSVQLYIQRGFLGLENSVGVDFTAEDAQTWQWMKNYRVWEAARKIFLWPENWIEPELRQVKTGFFREFESELLQSDLDEAGAEQAVVRYLEGLFDVAVPRICGLYHQQEYDGEERTVDVLHVFGQSRTSPPTTWYRRLEDGWRWTPWEKLEVPIGTQSIVPVMQDRRLMVFWPEVAVVTTVEGEVEIPSWEVRIHWTEYRDGQWSPMRQSDVLVTHTLENGNAEPYQLHLHVLQVNGNLRLNLYNVVRQDDKTEQFYRHWASYRLNPATWQLVDDLQTHSGTDMTGTAPNSGGIWYQGWKVSISKTTELKLVFGEYVEATGYADRRAVLDSLQTDMVQVYPGHYLVFTGQDYFALYDDDRVWMAVRADVAAAAGKGSGESADSTASYEASVRSGGFGLGMVEQLVLDQANKAAVVGVTIKGWAQEKTLTGQAGASDRSGSSHANKTQKAKASDAQKKQFTQQDEDTASANPNASVRLKFTPLYHPFVRDFLAQVRKHGVFGLLDPKRLGVQNGFQNQAKENDNFEALYSPTSVVREHPLETIDFEAGSPTGIYNWELFFHGPMLVAERLKQNQRFEEARQWHHVIYDPVQASSDGLDGWKLKPFQEDPGAKFSAMVQVASAGGEEAIENLTHQIQAWLESPFDPHVIAELRPGTYQRAFMMKYLDNLIAWGDALFRRDTMESLNEATQLYLMAGELLGERPEKVIASGEPAEASTFAGVDQDAEDGLGDTLKEMDLEAWGEVPFVSLLTNSTFCIPENPRLVGYWDVVEDRLYKIRHCMNIEGQVRQLALFEPPIDPGALVRASASGADLGTVLSNLSLNLPHYRFSYLIQRAYAYTGTVRGFGQALLAALEKQDGEEMALLRNQHELTVLDAMRQVRLGEIEAAEESLKAAHLAKALAVQRKEYYGGLIDKDLIAEEEDEDKYRNRAFVAQEVGIGFRTIASTMALIPEASTEVEVSVSPAVSTGLEWGGRELTSVANALASVFDGLSAWSNFSASKAARDASRVRRKQEWVQQHHMAEREMEQHDKLIESARLRVEISKQSLKQHDQQAANTKEIGEVMTSKYTNRELYNWMVGQLSSLYSRSYQLAFDVARRVEACYQYELARTDTTYIQYDYWDSLKRGLLAGDRLQVDLERMEASYLENDRREYEITKPVSLEQVDPIALLRLREEGVCFFELPEALFDLDFPGHYLRRIKGLTLSMPCVSGPFATVNAKLTLVSSKVRTSGVVSGGDYTHSDNYAVQSGVTESIAISTGQDDSGLFQFTFGDPRYLPFEGRGAVSVWKLELASSTPSLDPRSLSDVILTLRYMAREGGETLKTAAEGALEALNSATTGVTGETYTENDAGQVLGLSVRRDFADAFHAFLNHPTVESGDTTHSLALPITDALFPAAHRQVGLGDIIKVSLMLVTEGSFEATLTTASSASYNGALSLTGFTEWQSPQVLMATSGTLSAAPNGELEFHFHESDWGDLPTIEKDGEDQLDPEVLVDILVFFHYEVSG